MLQAHANCAACTFHIKGMCRCSHTPCRVQIRISFLQRLVTTEGEVTFRVGQRFALRKPVSDSAMLGEAYCPQLFSIPHHAVLALTTYNDRLHIMQGVRMEYSEPPAMAPCVTIAHEIDMESPLYGLRQNDFELKVSPALLPEEWQPSCLTRISLHGSQEKRTRLSIFLAPVGQAWAEPRHPAYMALHASWNLIVLPFLPGRRHLCKRVRHRRQQPSGLSCTHFRRS